MEDRSVKCQLAKKDNRSHHDHGGTVNFNRQEHSNSFIQRRDPRLNQQEITKQNIARNHKEGNKHYKRMPMELAEAAEEFDSLEFPPEDRKRDK